MISQRRNPPEKHQKENVNLTNSQEKHLQRSKEMCNKSNDSSQLKAKDNSCEQKLYILSDKGIETMEVKTWPCDKPDSPEKKIVVGRLNIQNAKSNLLNLKQCLKRCDVLCIQEHWYFSYEKKDLINISNAHETQAKSVDDYTKKGKCYSWKGLWRSCDILEERYKPCD